MNRYSSTFTLRTMLMVVSLSTLLGCTTIATEQKHQAAPTPLSTKTAQQSTPSNTDTIERSTSEPYKGDLSIFEDPKREQKLQIQRVMDILEIKEGSNVADIGAGSGWFAVRAGRRVGGSGTVYAVEINRDYLKHIEARAAQEKLTNVHTVLGKEDDPLLPANSIDAVLILKTYHEIAQPIQLLRHTRE
ncbi:MAG: class I SAM-dependent methyltransferase, partial [Pyrinomonadaceae bacterium]